MGGKYANCEYCDKRLQRVSLEKHKLTIKCLKTRGITPIGKGSNVCAKCYHRFKTPGELAAHKNDGCIEPCVAVATPLTEEVVQVEVVQVEVADSIESIIEPAPEPTAEPTTEPAAELIIEPAAEPAISEDSLSCDEVEPVQQDEQSSVTKQTTNNVQYESSDDYDDPYDAHINIDQMIANCKNPLGDPVREVSIDPPSLIDHTPKNIDVYSDNVDEDAKSENSENEPLVEDSLEDSNVVVDESVILDSLRGVVESSELALQESAELIESLEAEILHYKSSAEQSLIDHEAEVYLYKTLLDEKEHTICQLQVEISQNNGGVVTHEQRLFSDCLSHNVYTETLFKNDPFEGLASYIHDSVKDYVGPGKSLSEFYQFVIEDGDQYITESLDYIRGDVNGYYEKLYKARHQATDTFWKEHYTRLVEKTESVYKGVCLISKKSRRKLFIKLRRRLSEIVTLGV